VRGILSLPLAYAALVVGVIGTLMTDIVSAVGTRLGIARILPISRWVACPFPGRLRHVDIARRAQNE
jgi:hypothetical protein